jgi:hypothetical protein
MSNPLDLMQQKMALLQEAEMALYAIETDAPQLYGRTHPVICLEKLVLAGLRSWLRA